MPRRRTPPLATPGRATNDVNDCPGNSVQPRTISVIVGNRQQTDASADQARQSSQSAKFRRCRVSVLTEIITDHDQPFVPCMFTANIRGGFAVKTDELAAVLHDNCVDIACITETFLNESVPSEVLDILG